MLPDEIHTAQRRVRTDAYQMSIGEIVNMYNEGEITIAPDFQRLFRWSNGQKSRLIESLLLGIPLPSIFVFEKDDGKWELIDGLQRISTVLEFMGQLKSPEGALAAPSILDSTKYLPSLHNTVWESSDRIEGADVAEQVVLDKALQLAIRRSRISVEILKRPSDEKTKYDLFQRLNAGGTQANAQELRNCIMLMVNARDYQLVKASAERASFQSVMNISEEQMEKQRHMELAVRFLVHVNVPYDGKLDVEEYMDEGIAEVLSGGQVATATNLMDQTFDLLFQAAGADALRRFENGHHVGKVGLVGLEAIAVGVAKNLPTICAKQDAIVSLAKSITKFWTQPAIANFVSLGMRGTTRIQRTIPYGNDWFSR